MKKQNKGETKTMWLILAVLSAVFAALTSIFAKVGIENVNSHLATALRTFRPICRVYAIQAKAGCLLHPVGIHLRHFLYAVSVDVYLPRTVVFFRFSHTVFREDTYLTDIVEPR